jgi:hypothetical protein
MSVAPSEKMCFLHHFDICDKRGDHITDIDPFLFGKKFDIFISGKYAEKNEQVFTCSLLSVFFLSFYIFMML